MKKLLPLILLTLALTGGGPVATAWERDAFKAIKDLAREQTEQAKAEKEKAAREKAERERAEQAEREQAERERAELEADRAKLEAEREKWEQERQQAERERAERERAEQAKREQERQQAEREKWKAERRAWEQDRQKWERERQQAEQATDKAEQAPAEQAERDRNEEAAREQVAKEQAERDRAERERQERERAEREQARQEAEQAPAKPEKKLNAYQKRMAAMAEQERQWELEREREYAEQERQEIEQLCNDTFRPLADDFSIVEYAQGKGVLTPDQVKKVREAIKACKLDIRTAAGGPSCPHYLFAMRRQEEKTQSDRHKALEAEGIYEQMKYAKSKGLLTPSQEMEIDALKNDLWEKKKAKNASQRKFEILYRQADEAGCLDEQS